MFSIFSGKREESFQELLTDIRKKAKLRDGLVTKFEAIEEKINQNSEEQNINRTPPIIAGVN